MPPLNVKKKKNHHYRTSSRPQRKTLLSSTTLQSVKKAINRRGVSTSPWPFWSFQKERIVVCDFLSVCVCVFPPQKRKEIYIFCFSCVFCLPFPLGIFFLTLYVFRETTNIRHARINQRLGIRGRKPRRCQLAHHFDVRFAHVAM